MVKETDLLIIGGGMAGAITAIVASKSGLRTIVVRPGYGATALSSGVVNLNGTVEWLRRTLGADKPYEATVKQAVTRFLDLMAQAGYPYVGDFTTTCSFINMLGTIKQAQLCPETMAAGDINTFKDAHVLFIGIPGLNDHDAHNIAQSAAFFSASRLVDISFKTDWTEVEFPQIKRSSNLSVFDLARLMDKEEVVTEFAQKISEKVDLTTFTHVAFPPIFGIKNPTKVKKALQETLGRPCFEIVAIPPSVPGFRLQKALDWLMGEYGVEIVHGRVGGYEAKEGKIVAVKAADKTVLYEFEPKVVLLASGKFISGGIAWDKNLKETIFDLPVCVDGTFDIPAGMGTLIADQYVADQKMFSAGVRINEGLHPVAPNGKVIFDNLYASGSILTGYNYTQGDGGLGIPLLTGCISAISIVKQIAGEGAIV